MRNGCGCSCQDFGFGPDPGAGLRGRSSAKEWLQRLKEYQRDLEQEVANVAELIRRLGGRAAGENAPA